MSRAPVFGVPPAPAAIAGEGPIRIVDPAGGAVAWFAPGVRAGCTGFAVRRPGPPAGGWTHVVAPDVQPTRAGARWITPIVLLAGRSGARGDAGNRVAPLCWEFAERDPTMVALEVETGFGVRLRFAAALEDAALTLSVEATNHGASCAAIGLGLRFRAALVAPASDRSARSAGTHPGTVVARGLTPDGAPLAIAAMEGVVAVEPETRAPVEDACLLVLGYRPPRVLVDLPRHGRTRVAASIGVGDG